MRGMVSIQEFRSLGMKVGRILSVKDIPEADRLYLLEVDIGKKIQLVAGIKQDYTPEQLRGRDIVVVSNLDHAVIKGFKSEGMLLAAESRGRAVLLTPDKNTEPGSEIR